MLYQSYMHPFFTGNGWEMADDTNTLPPENISTIYKTQADCQQAIVNERFNTLGFDELRAMESRYDN